MNILFFITPKSEIAYIYEDDSIRQALEKMEYHKFSAVPLLTRDGKYVGTITEGDMLWGIKNQYNLKLEGGRRNFCQHTEAQDGLSSGFCKVQYGRYD